MDIMNLIIQKALILIPALYIIGCILKRTDFIKDKYIPIVLLPLGILGAIGIIGFSAESVIQGILITGAAVYGNQVCKQIMKNEGASKGKAEK